MARAYMLAILAVRLFWNCIFVTPNVLNADLLFILPSGWISLDQPGYPMFVINVAVFRSERIVVEYRFLEENPVLGYQV